MRKFLALIIVTCMLLSGMALLSFDFENEKAGKEVQKGQAGTRATLIVGRGRRIRRYKAR